MGSGGRGAWAGAWGQTEFQVNLKLGLTPRRTDPAEDAILSRASDTSCPTRRPGVGSRSSRACRRRGEAWGRGGMGSGRHGVGEAWGQTEFQVNLKLGLTPRRRTEGQGEKVARITRATCLIRTNFYRLKTRF